jgi:hypothetical protein
MKRNGRKRRVSVAQDEVLCRRAELRGLRVVLEDAMKFVQPYASEDVAAYDLMNELEFKIFQLGRKLSTSEVPAAEPSTTSE